jgi:hypothetical protein
MCLSVQALHVAQTVPLPCNEDQHTLPYFDPIFYSHCQVQVVFYVALISTISSSPVHGPRSGGSHIASGPSSRTQMNELMNAMLKRFWLRPR